MARSSHPFSSFSSGKEKEERPRKVKQNRFFEHDRNAPTAKFEKLHEIPREQIGTAFAPPMENQKSESAIRIKVISNPETIVENEVARVHWYLDEYQRYKDLGYDSIIRLPQDIEAENGKVITDDEIKAAVQKEFDSDRAEYEAYAHDLQETWNAMSAKMQSTAAEVYGFSPSGNFKLVPTAYGTGGGSLKKGGVVFFKLPKYRPAGRRTEAEAITHEVLNHEATAELREGTAVDDTIFATHQWYKERLMDLLGRTLLVRSGLMEREKVVMDDYAEQEAANLVDPLYYADPEHPDENNLRYEGKLPDLIRLIEAKLTLF